ncbi:dermonecrotic toxin domain-containing protein [Pseudomonas sichuanensis]
MTHSPLSPHLAFIHHRLAQWIAGATAAERKQLERRVRASHAAMRRVQQALSPVQGIEAFCRPLLEEALPRWFPGRDLPSVEQGWVGRGNRTSSWLEAALQNFDADTSIELYTRTSSLERFGKENASVAGDAHTFVSGVRNLDLGQRYRYHLQDHIDTDAFREALRQHDRAAFAAELSQASLQGHLDPRVALMGETVYAGLADSARQQLQCGYLSLFGIPLSGPMLIRMQPRDEVEACLLYLPGHPHQPLRQYPSLQAAATALTRLLHQQDERTFFSRYVSHVEQPRFAARLRSTLYPRYPYAELHPTPPVLEKGKHFSWIKRAFPAPTDLWQETLDLDASLELSFTPWAKDAFVERARTQVEQRLADAAAIAVPVAQRDAAAQLARVEQWLGVGLNVLNVAGFFVPALGELLLVIGGAQIVNEVLEGVHTANEGDADAAIGHLFGVLENLALFGALGAAGHFAEPLGALHDWSRIGAGEAQKLWPGELTPFARPRPWPQDRVPDSRGLYHWQEHLWLARDDMALALEQASDGSLKLAPVKGLHHQPELLGNGQGTWLLEHDRPLAWPDATLLGRLGPATEKLDASQLAQALRCSGYDSATLRRTLLDHRPIPALLLDSLEAFGGRPALAPAKPSPMARVLARDFPGLSHNARTEIVAQASPTDLKLFQNTERLPLTVAETARLYLRESRICKALARFHQDSGPVSDRDSLVFAMLPRLPGWTGNLRIELRASVPKGELLAATGEPGRAAKVLVRTEQGYKPYDEQGNELAGYEDLHRALLHAMPDSERNALGLHIHEGPTLRDRLFNLAASDRRRAALDLGMTPVRPQYRLPSRLPGERRIGYRLSGRGRGWLSEDELFDQLYPATPEGDREMLRQRLRYQAGPLTGAFGRLLDRLRVEYRQLDTALQRWVHAPEGLPVGAFEQQRALREAAAQRIRSAWRRESAQGPDDNIDDINLVIEGAGLSSLPTLPVRLPHIRLLSLNGLGTLDMADLNAFLGAFPRLLLLDLAENTLEQLPQALAEMGELQALDLSENNLDLDDDANLSLLAGMTHLQRLNLTDGIRGLSVATLERLSTLPSLAWFQADLNELVMTAEHFQALQRWPALRGLSLGQNAIVLDEAARAALAGLDRLQMLVLHENPLDLAPDLTGWTQLQQLDLESSNISQWPIGLEALMNQEPLELRHLDLSANELIDAPDLQHSTYARAIRESHPGIAYALNGNPFSDMALGILADAGFTVTAPIGQGYLWTADWPEELQLHINSTAQAPQWGPLYDLLQRLPDTPDFQSAPVAMTQRMQRVVQLLATDEAGAVGGGWGRAQVQQQIIDLLNDATEECVDQAILLFQEVETEVTLWQAVNHAAADDTDEQVAVQSILALLRQRVLDEHVGALYQARKARRTALRADGHDPARDTAPPLHPDDDISDQELTSDHPDELEMALLARIHLKERLGLPAQPQFMRFPMLAHLNDATLQRLGDAVVASTDASSLIDWAVRQRFWQSWVRRLRPQAFETLRDRWEGASQYFDSLSEASDTIGAYTGPAVPPAYIDALERELGAVPGLHWRIDGTVQRVDLVSARYPNEGALYQRAAELLLSARQADESALLEELTEVMVNVYHR